MDENDTSSSCWVWPEAELSDPGSTSLLLPLQQDSRLPEPKSCPKGFCCFCPGRVARDTLPSMAAGLGAALVFLELSHSGSCLRPAEPGVGWDVPCFVGSHLGRGLRPGQGSGGSRNVLALRWCASFAPPCLGTGGVHHVPSGAATPARAAGARRPRAASPPGQHLHHG